MSKALGRDSRQRPTFRQIWRAIWRSRRSFGHKFSTRDARDGAVTPPLPRAGMSGFWYAQTAWCPMTVRFPSGLGSTPLDDGLFSLVYPHQHLQGRPVKISATIGLPLSITCLGDPSGRPPGFAASTRSLVRSILTTAVSCITIEKPCLNFLTQRKGGVMQCQAFK